MLQSLMAWLSCDANRTADRLKAWFFRGVS